MGSRPRISSLAMESNYSDKVDVCCEKRALDHTLDYSSTESNYSD